ncbi:MAG: uracil-DNA glycosylase [Alphaproteobacteria bacterium]|nr:uracil-DNA glycosylase [Alphaproteobacteria bacterium]
MTKKSAIQLPKDWLAIIGGEFECPYMVKLKKYLQQEKNSGRVVYPKGTEIFNALNTTPFENIKVVILGQDPYHGPNQAHGLAFSVQKGIPIPPSLLNIYKEIKQEFGTEIPRHGDLTHWARQGVLLINATLTVRQASAGSHQGKGWEEFTDTVIREINDRLTHVVFMLWGAYAQKKGAFINSEKHLILTAPHPSPLSAHRGFMGCGHFLKANKYLKQHGHSPVDWEIADIA